MNINGHIVNVEGVVYDEKRGVYTTGKKGQPPKLKLSKEELASMRSCMSVTLMAKHLGVSRTTIYKYLHDAGLE